MNDPLPVPRPAPDDAPDDIADRLRLDRYRDTHPGVTIRASGHLPGSEDWWQARIPHANGETVLTRYLLGDLLDTLDGLDGPEPQDSS